METLVIAGHIVPGGRFVPAQCIGVGQVCVDKAWRGQGILDHCYATYREQYRNKYDFAITEIAGGNLRSLKAHRRIGFKEINKYVSPDKTEWIVVLWDWHGDH